MFLGRFNFRRSKMQTAATNLTHRQFDNAWLEKKKTKNVTNVSYAASHTFGTGGYEMLKFETLKISHSFFAVCKTESGSSFIL